MEENVFIDNSAATGVTLACTVSLPPGAKPHPAAVLITGSGPEDRDETIFGHKPFLILSDHLTRKGIAVLRCDDRGMAKSTGTFLTAELRDFASDVRAELAFLRSRKDIDTKRIGLIGHSEGGVIGPMIAAEDHDVAFLVMMAGLGVTGEELAIEQRALILGSMGATPAQMDASRIASRKLFDAVLAAPDQAGAIAAAKQQLQAEAKESGITEAATDAAAMQFASTSLLSLLAYDPAPVLKKVAAPILAINGSKDLQVPPSQNLGGLRKILAGRRNVTIVELPGLNHLFQTTKTGRISEYAEIEETISPLALNTISDWLVKTVTP
jgi:pimeloyl-ACP methyl ester carboxylesterase